MTMLCATWSFGDPPPSVADAGAERQLEHGRGGASLSLPGHNRTVRRGRGGGHTGQDLASVRARQPSQRGRRLWMEKDRRSDRRRAPGRTRCADRRRADRHANPVLRQPDNLLIPDSALLRAESAPDRVAALIDRSETRLVYQALVDGLLVGHPLQGPSVESLERPVHQFVGAVATIGAPAGVVRPGHRLNRPASPRI